MKELGKYLKPYVGAMVVGLLIKIAATIVELCLPWILSYMIDYIIPKKDITLIGVFGGLMLVCTVTAIVFNISANRRASKVARNVTERLRLDLFQKIFQLSNGQTDRLTTPSMISRLTSDTYNVNQMVGMMQRLGVRAPIMFLGGIIITFTLDVTLTLVMLSVLPILLVLIVLIYKKAMPMYQVLQRKLDRFVEVVREDAGGIRVIKALSKTEYEEERFQGVSSDLVEQEKNAGMTMGVLNPAMNLFLNIGMVLVILIGGYRVNAGTSKPGTIIAFMSYVVLILNAVLFISRMFVIFSKAIASMNRIGEVLALENEYFVEEEKAWEDREVQSENYLTFEDVTFAYDLKGGPVVQNISLDLKKGETLGIIGPTGAGKTTLIHLLMRFYEPTKGRIVLDGKPLISYPKEALRQKFGVVFQNDVLLKESIYENIRFGRQIGEEEIRKAIKCAMAEEFIGEKKEGYHSNLDIRGANLSGGQKQRLLIARALAARPEILILDDSSSALDYKTDAKLRQGLLKHYKETTTILVAQRVSSVMSADKILVLEDGKIVGIGSHDELMKHCSLYQELSRLQMGGEKA